MSIELSDKQRIYKLERKFIALAKKVAFLEKGLKGETDRNNCAYCNGCPKCL